jgi:hypothetical protein
MMAGEELLEIVNVAASVLSALSAAVAARYSLLAVRSSHAAYQGPLYLQLLERYGSEEFGAALRTLRDWARQHGADHYQTWLEDISARERPDFAAAENVDRARRRVSYFYVNLFRLVQSKLIDRQLARSILSLDGYAIFFHVVVPFEYKPDAGDVHKALFVDLEQCFYDCPEIATPKAPEGCPPRNKLKGHFRFANGA